MVTIASSVDQPDMESLPPVFLVVLVLVLFVVGTYPLSTAVHRVSAREIGTAELAAEDVDAVAVPLEQLILVSATVALQLWRFTALWNLFHPSQHAIRLVQFTPR